MAEVSAPARPGKPHSVLAILGPTASGKTQLSVSLAKALGGELLNADSRQAIAELAIGVCKPTSEELQGVACHGLNWSHLGAPFSAAVYRTLATTAIEEIAGRGRTAIVVGGTGLYIRSLLGGFDFGGVAPDRSRTDQLTDSAEERRLAGPAVRELRRLDPQLAQEVDLENPRRVIRAAELARASTRASQAPPPWSVLKLGCRVGSSELRLRIEARSEALVAEPLVEEVEALQSRGFSPELLARSAIGYSEVVDWVQGHCTRQEAVERIAARTWRYAKAQLTWLRSEPDLVWIEGSLRPDEMVSQSLAVIQTGQGPRSG
ncbi:MAG: tRNA (adenosine(37)-N6)-dimethylallyltransferase MiaA [Candidatus Dormiibacterota bacterium]